MLENNRFPATAEFYQGHLHYRTILVIVRTSEGCILRVGDPTMRRGGIFLSEDEGVTYRHLYIHSFEGNEVAGARIICADPYEDLNKTVEGEFYLGARLLIIDGKPFRRSSLPHDDYAVQYLPEEFLQTLAGC